MQCPENDHEKPRLPARIHALSRVGSRVVDDRIAAMRREGKEVLPLSAYPSRPLPPDVLERARWALEHLEHAPNRGLPGLRHAVASLHRERTERRIDPDREVLITAGAMHALLCTMLAILDPGDEVLVLTPSYFFDGSIGLAGGVLKPVPLDASDGFQWHVDRIERAIGPRTRAILLNTPANPTGVVASGECLEDIAALAQRHELFVVCDESYDQMVYDGRTHVSLLAINANRSRNILVASFTKSFALAEWRVGYTVTSPSVTDAILKALEWSALFGSALNQLVAEAVLQSDRRWLLDVQQQFQANRDLMLAEILRSPELSCAIPAGNPFVFIDFQRCGRPDEYVSDLLLDRYGIPCTPGVLHGQSGYVRVPFGGPPATVVQAGRRIVEAAAHLRAGG